MPEVRRIGEAANEVRMESRKPMVMNSNRKPEELFNNGRTIVTKETIRHNAQVYPIRTVVKVSDFKMPMEIKNLVINIIVGLIGLAAILSLNLIAVIIGLIFTGICAWNTYDILTRPHYLIVIEFSNGERLEFDFPQIEVAIKLRDAIHDAIGTH